MDQQKRQVAYIYPISSLKNAKFVREEGWTPNYLLIGQNKVSRISTTATIISKDEQANNQRMVIDDGTASISLISFESMPHFEELMEGDSVRIIGRPRVYDDEVYLLPEAIKKVDKMWIKVAAHQARKEGAKEIIKDEAPQETGIEDNDIIELIRVLDKGEGVRPDEISRRYTKADLDRQITSLLESGEIFEITPGRYKVLE